MANKYKESALSSENSTEGDPKSRFGEGWHKYFSSGRAIRKNPNIIIESIASAYLEMFFRERKLASGTGFFWRHEVGIALVTAWHNFSGLHHTLREPLASHGGLPDRIKIRYMAREPRLFKEEILPLYVDDAADQPRWMVHREVGSFFDIAFLLLNLEGHDVFCANDKGVFSENLQPGSDVFAVGYPQGINTIGVIPIWKRGTVASEMDLPTEGHPKFLVDMTGRGGLSGAPYIGFNEGY